MRQDLLMGAFASVLLFGGTGAFAQEPGNIAAGRRIAHQWCSECHKIDPAQRLVDPDAQAPTFVEVANEPSTTPLSLRAFFHLDPQADDLVAYILSLNKQKEK
jgi:mono/diheme cytochrome c family protein